MDSNVPMTTTPSRFLPFYGVLAADLTTMARSWLVRIWLVISALVAFGIIMESVKKGRLAQEVVPELLQTHLVVWSTMVIVLSAALPAERGPTADSILSRGVTRYAYLLAKYLSRLLTVLVVSVAVLAPAAFFTHLHLKGDCSIPGTMMGLLLLLLAYALLLCVGFVLGLCFQTQFYAIPVTWAFAYFSSAIAKALKLRHLSPHSLIAKFRALAVDTPADSLIAKFRTFADDTPADIPDWQIAAELLLPTVVLLLIACIWFSRKDV